MVRGTKRSYSRQPIRTKATPRRSRAQGGFSVSNIARTVAGEAARQAGDYVVNSLTNMVMDSPKNPFRTFTQTKGKKKWTGPKQSDARFVGPFRKPRRKFVRGNDKFLTYGYTTHREGSGRVTDADCAYIGHASYSGRDAIANLCASMIRYLFRKVGKEIVNPEQTFIDDVAGNYTLQLNQRDNASGAITARLSHTIAGGDNLHNLADIVRQSLEVLLSDDITEPLTPYSLVMYKKVTIGVNSSPLDKCGEVCFENINVHMKSRSVLKIQNQTVFGATAGPGDPEGDDSDDVNNQPVKGKVYEINSTTPILKTSKGRDGLGTSPNNSGFEFDEEYGVVTKRASQVTNLSNVFKDPPHPKEFGASKANNILVQPGHIKSSTLYTKKSMDGLKYLRLLGVTNVHPFLTRSTIGKSRIYALEKMINWGANYIALVFECEVETAVYFTFKKARPIAKYNIWQTASNEQPTPP